MHMAQIHLHNGKRTKTLNHIIYTTAAKAEAEWQHRRGKHAKYDRFRRILIYSLVHSLFHFRSWIRIELKQADFLQRPISTAMVRSL